MDSTKSPSEGHHIPRWRLMGSIGVVALVAGSLFRLLLL
jgi:hypothetical protein